MTRQLVCPLNNKRQNKISEGSSNKLPNPTTNIPHSTSPRNLIRKSKHHYQYKCITQSLQFHTHTQILFHSYNKQIQTRNNHYISTSKGKRANKSRPVAIKVGKKWIKRHIEWIHLWPVNRIHGPLARALWSAFNL